MFKHALKSVAVFLATLLLLLVTFALGGIAAKHKIKFQCEAFKQATIYGYVYNCERKGHVESKHPEK